MTIRMHISQKWKCNILLGLFQCFITIKPSTCKKKKKIQRINLIYFFFLTWVSVTQCFNVYNVVTRVVINVFGTIIWLSIIRFFYRVISVKMSIPAGRLLRYVTRVNIMYNNNINCVYSLLFVYIENIPKTKYMHEKKKQKKTIKWIIYNVNQTVTHTCTAILYYYDTYYFAVTILKIIMISFTSRSALIKASPSIVMLVGNERAHESGVIIAFAIHRWYVLFLNRFVPFIRHSCRESPVRTPRRRSRHPPFRSCSIETILLCATEIINSLRDGNNNNYQRRSKPVGSRVAETHVSKHSHTFRNPTYIRGRSDYGIDLYFFFFLNTYDRVT